MVAGYTMASNKDTSVHHLDQSAQAGRQRSKAGGDGGGSDDGLERRLADIESQLATLNERTKHLATKEDVKDAVLGALKWAGGILVSLAFIVLTTVRYFGRLRLENFGDYIQLLTAALGLLTSHDSRQTFGYAYPIPPLVSYRVKMR